MASTLPTTLPILAREIAACDLCPRLRAHCRTVGELKRRAYLDWDYWARPVPGFGDPRARVLVIGLAPGAHGANRTGRMFTGDSSGDFLYRALYETGFASQPTSTSRDDGLRLTGMYISAAARCAPPGNRPERDELARCRPYLEREIALLPGLRVVVALGGIAFKTYRAIHGLTALPFGHNQLYRPSPNLPALLASYHPSQQNTSTGRLTREMLRQVFERARALSL